MNTKRLECAWLLREAAWALKRHADRIERCVVQPTTDNEAKAQAWLDRAVRRVAKFSQARREYLGIKASSTTTSDFDSWFRDVQDYWYGSSGKYAKQNAGIDRLFNIAFKELDRSPREFAYANSKREKPWRTPYLGHPKPGVPVKVFTRSGKIVDLATLGTSGDKANQIMAWRYA